MPELQALPGLRRVVRLAGLEVGDARAAALERADPVDHPDDRGALERELEEQLVRERLAHAVVAPPVREHPVLDQLAERGRDRLRRELLLAPAPVELGEDLRPSCCPTRCRSRSSIRPWTSLPTHALNPATRPRPSSSPSTCCSSQLSSVRQARVRQAQAPRGAAGRSRSSRAGTTRWTGRRRSPAGRRAPRAGATPRPTGRRAGGARARRPRGRSPAGRPRRSGAGRPRRPRRARRRTASAATARRGGRRTATSTTRRVARASDHPEESPFVGEPLADVRSDRVIAPSSAARSNIGSGRVQRREVALDRAGHDHGVELAAGGAVGGQHLHGVGAAGLPRRPARAVLARRRAPPGTPRRRSRRPRSRPRPRRRT